MQQRWIGGETIIVVGALDIWQGIKVKLDKKRKQNMETIQTIDKEI